MASLKSLPILAVLLLAATASARPCKTLFYFSATTTFYPNPNSLSNPNPNPQNHPRYFTLIFTTTSFSDPRPNSLDSDSKPISATTSFSDLPSKFYSSIPASIRDRTKDIMSVVGALLFGIGCGALTAAVMYFLWALFAPGRFDLVGGELSDDDDDVAAAKRKLGYVVIPTKNVEDEVKKPAKEVV